MNRSDTREDFTQALLAFVNGPLVSRHGPKHTPPGAVDETTPLFETGVVDSLGILDLLAFVESATGRPIPMQKIDMRYFGSIRRIASAFWVDSGCP